MRKTRGSSGKRVRVRARGALEYGGWFLFKSTDEGVASFRAVGEM